MLTVSNLWAQKLSANLFPANVIHEEFTISSENWPTITSTDNYFIFDKGDYLLSRTHKESEYAILAANSQDFQDFAIKTSIRIGPSDNPKSNLGLILKAQKDGKGAVIVEFNRNKKYRIKQLAGFYYSNITGKTNDDGWVKSPKMQGGDQANTIEIRCKSNLYELYINSKYETTFFLNVYLSGSVGIIIGPETKARVEYFYLNTNEKAEGATKNNEESKQQKEEIENLTVELSTKVTLLKKLEEENQQYEDEISSLRKEIKNIKQNLEEVKQQNTSLSNANSELRNNITTANTSNNTSISEKQSEINTLNNQLKIEKSNVASLQSEVNVLKTKVKKIALLESKIEDTEVINIEQVKLLNSKITKLNDKISKLEDEKNNLNNSLTSERKSANELKIVNTSDKQEITTLNNQISNLKKKVEQKSSEIITLKSDLKTEKSKATKSATDIKKLNTNNKQEITTLNNQISNLNNKISGLQKEKDNLSAKLSAQSKSGSKKEKDLQKEISSLKKNLTATTAELKTNKQQKNKMQNEIANIESFKQKSKGEKEELVIKNNSLNQKIAAINKQIKALTDSINASDKRYEDLKSFMVSQGIIKNGGVKKTTPITTNVEQNLEGKEFYSVQLGVFIAPVPDSRFSNAKDIYNIKNEDGIFLYLSGEYQNLNDAIREKNNLIGKGENNLYVVKVIDRRKVVLVE